MGSLSDDERAQLLPAEDVPHRFPIPTQIVSSDEYFPEAQTAQQKQFELRLADIGDHLARRQGLSRRRFFQTASGMAAAFLAMNQVYGKLFAVTEAEAATPEMADQRAITLRGQDVFDAHTHFLPEDMQQQHGFAPLGAADGPVKRGILAKNGFRLFGYNRHAELATPDRFAAIKDDYLRNGADPSNLRYGYVRRA